MAQKHIKTKKQFQEYLLSIKWAKIFINGEETKYSISNEGSVINNKTQKCLTTHATYPGDYLKVNLTHNGKAYQKLVHRLVAEAFIPNPDNKPQVNHKDGNKMNPSASNLEWVNRSENMKHAIDIGLLTVKRGKEHPNAKYDEDTIHAICKLLEDLKHPKEIAKILNIPVSVPTNIKLRQTWVEISSGYNIPLPKEIARSRRLEPQQSKKYSPDKIHQICQLLEDGNRVVDIAKMADVPTCLVYDIKNKRVWSSYSNQYNIPYSESKKNVERHKNPIYDQAVKILKSDDHITYERVIELLGVPDNIATRRYLAHLRYKIRTKQECSTTIESII